MIGFTLNAWLLSFITIFCPIWATILWFIPIKSKWMYPISAIGMYIPTVLWAFNPIKMRGVTPWLHWYGLFFIFYIAVFGMKLNWTDWNKASSIALFAIFIAGEWWEIPIFVYDYLGKINILNNVWTGSIIDGAWIFSHMRRIYTIAACFLLGTIAKIEMTPRSWIFLLTGTVICFILLLPIGLGYHIGHKLLVPLAHITSLSFTGIIILDGYGGNG